MLYSALLFGVVDKAKQRAFSLEQCVAMQLAQWPASEALEEKVMSFILLEGL